MLASSFRNLHDHLHRRQPRGLHCHHNIREPSGAFFRLFTLFNEKNLARVGMQNIFSLKKNAIIF